MSKEVGNLAEDGLHVDGQVSVWAAKSSHDAEAQSFRTFLQSDAVGPRAPDKRNKVNKQRERERVREGKVCVCVWTHSGSPVCESVLADRLELLDKFST